jgi:hypothetical protein
MSIGTFTAIIDQIAPYARLIKLSYIGEPLLNRDIVSMISYAKTNTDAKVVMFTNGALLTHKLRAEIIASGLDEIVFSIDAVSPQVYEAIRRGGKAHLVWRNIEEFLVLKGDRRPNATINCVKLSLNQRERQEPREYWGQLRCPVYFSTMTNWSGQAGIEHLSSDRKRRSQDDNSRAPCAELWYKIVINAVGDIVLCCNDFRAVETLANVIRDGVNAVWTSAKMAAIRRAHVEGRFETLPLCSTCSNWSDAFEMEALVRGRMSRALRP